LRANDWPSDNVLRIRKERFLLDMVDASRGQFEVSMNPREHDSRIARITALTMGGLFIVIYALNAITF
jgi:hypothetical protein